MSQGIVITGAGSGIGRATARAFLAAGWRVALIGRREAALIETAGDSPALILPCDVTDPAAVDAAFARIAAEWGHLDVLFNNAGMSLKGAPIDEIPVADKHTLDGGKYLRHVSGFRASPTCLLSLAPAHAHERASSRCCSMLQPAAVDSTALARSAAGR